MVPSQVQVIFDENYLVVIWTKNFRIFVAVSRVAIFEQNDPFCPIISQVLEKGQFWSEIRNQNFRWNSKMSISDQNGLFWISSIGEKANFWSKMAWFEFPFIQ